MFGNNASASGMCAKHEDQPTVARCTNCFQAVCEKCLVEQDTLSFCGEKCVRAYKKRTAGGKPVGPVPRGDPMLVLAAVLVGLFAIGSGVFPHAKKQYEKYQSAKAAQEREERQSTIDTANPQQEIAREIEPRKAAGEAVKLMNSLDALKWSMEKRKKAIVCAQFHPKAVSRPFGTDAKTSYTSFLSLVRSHSPDGLKIRKTGTVTGPPRKGCYETPITLEMRKGKGAAARASTMQVLLRWSKAKDGWRVSEVTALTPVTPVNHKK